MPEPKEWYCCYADHVPAREPGSAEWEVYYYPFGPDDWTHSCSKHLGDMMTDACEHRVYPVRVNILQEAVNA